LHKNLKMKHIFYLMLFLPSLLFSQSDDCFYYMNVSTDSISIKVLNEEVMYERIYGNSEEIVLFKLLNNDGVPIVNVQLLQKNTDFIPTNCFNKSSKIVFQLVNGKIVTLHSITEDNCGILSYEEKEKINTRLLDGYFAFAKNNYEELKKSPISLMRIQFVGQAKEYVINSVIESEFQNKIYYPENIFVSFLKCIE